MCGIVGLFNMRRANVNVDPIVQAFVGRFLMVETLVALLPRGDDASGMAVLWDDKETAIVKQPVESPFFTVNDGTYTPAEKFQNKKDPDATFKWLMSKWFRGYPDVAISQALGHVRKATTGNIYDNNNNHPLVGAKEIKDGKFIDKSVVVGVHNGAIKNHKKLFSDHKLPRIGEVDSEVIFQLMAQYDSLSNKELAEVYNKLEGAMAVMAYRPDEPLKAYGLKNTHRPLHSAWLPAIGSLILVSEKKYLVKALEAYERWRVSTNGARMVVSVSDSEEVEIGDIYDELPYVEATWGSKEIMSGVFTIDLDQDISKEVKDANDFLDHEFHATKTTTYTTTHVTDKRSLYGSYKPAATVASTSATTKTTQTSTTTAAVTKPKLVDYSDYDKDDDKLDVSPVPLPSAEEMLDDDAEYEVEIETVGEELTSLNDDTPEDSVEDVDGLPYTWSELRAIATDLLYEEAHRDERLLLNQESKTIAAELRKYVQADLPEHDLVAILYCLYDVIFPEGFVYGFRQGYEFASEENEGQDESGLAEKLKEAMKREAQLVATISQLKRKEKGLKQKHDKATKMIAALKKKVDTSTQRKTPSMMTNIRKSFRYW